MYIYIMYIISVFPSLSLSLFGIWHHFNTCMYIYIYIHSSHTHIHTSHTPLDFQGQKRFTYIPRHGARLCRSPAEVRHQGQHHQGLLYPQRISLLRSFIRNSSLCVKLSFRGGFSRCSTVPYPV